MKRRFHWRRSRSKPQYHKRLSVKLELRIAGHGLKRYCRHQGRHRVELAVHGRLHFKSSGVARCVDYSSVFTGNPPLQTVRGISHATLLIRCQLLTQVNIRKYRKGDRLLWLTPPTGTR